jgi:RNA polymerase sigma-70 factor (ECF subfamily)
MAPDDFTDLGGIRTAFLTTHWSLIQRVSDETDQDEQRALIELLLKRYWKPVYCYLRRRGLPNEEAKDLTQAFFHDVVLGHNLIEKSEPSRGRFRSFLIMALKRYLSTAREKETAQKRIPKSKRISLEAVDEAQLHHACTQVTPEDAFNYAWISALLERVVEEVRAGCCQDGKSVHWHVFRERVLDPIMERSDAPSMHELCHKYGVPDQAKASNMIVTIKRRFGATLRKHLRDSVASEEEVDDELREMMRFLPKIAQDGA